MPNFCKFSDNTWTASTAVTRLCPMTYTFHMTSASILASIAFRTQDRLMTDILWWIAILWFGCLGGCVGSFLTVVWDRLGTGEGFVLPRSRCPECDHPIRWYHNIPIVGWFLLGGRCYDCGSPIPFKHPLIEALFAAVFMVAGWSILPRL
jgi:Bacterial Peptidase A24 N-terminal domain